MLTWAQRATRHIFIQQRVSAIIAGKHDNAYGVALQWGWLEPETHIRRATEQTFSAWVHRPIDGHGIAFRIWRACNNAHWQIDRLNEQTPYFHPDAPSILTQAYADLAALDQ